MIRQKFWTGTAWAKLGNTVTVALNPWPNIQFDLLHRKKAKAWDSWLGVIKNHYPPTPTYYSGSTLKKFFAFYFCDLGIIMFRSSNTLEGMLSLGNIVMYLLNWKLRMSISYLMFLLLN